MMELTGFQQIAMLGLHLSGDYYVIISVGINQ